MCRTPVPEIRDVNPPPSSSFGMLRADKVMTSAEKQRVLRGESVTIQTAEVGKDGECWYRVRVKNSGNVGWMHSINVP